MLEEESREGSLKHDLKEEEGQEKSEQGQPPARDKELETQTSSDRVDTSDKELQGHDLNFEHLDLEQNQDSDSDTPDEDSDLESDLNSSDNDVALDMLEGVVSGEVKGDGESKTGSQKVRSVQEFDYERSAGSTPPPPVNLYLTLMSVFSGALQYYRGLL